MRHRHVSLKLVNCMSISCFIQNNQKKSVRAKRWHDSNDEIETMTKVFEYTN